MVVSLDTNIWIFGFFGTDVFCEKIIMNLSGFQIIMPDQIRAELERNLPGQYMKQFYLLAIEAGVKFDFERVPHSYITMFEQKGLKKGDLTIGAFCEWRRVDIIVSNNRNFLRGLSGEHCFQVMSPQKFCKNFNLL
ncbi:MAG: type II toxin-antitoxin system VapC family toxin [Desulfobacteraceae bacterium]|nr:type II toxin-antitoxin system VapC family toxin [Desulfobacteraceae bacterium]